MPETVLENGFLRVQANALGAELVSVVHKASGRECLWQRDAAVWNGQAPLLFPHCGGLFDSTLRLGAKEYPAQKHGFARKSTFVQEEAKDALCFVLHSGTQTQKLYPYDFVLRVTFTLQQSTLVQTVQVQNPPQQKTTLPFSVGFHPAFALPFATGRKTEDYEIVFDSPQSPVAIETPLGFVSGESRVLCQNQTKIPLHDNMFASDSICMSSLTCKTMALHDKVSGQSIVLDVAEFPYVLLWGQAKGPLTYVCIEPWHSLPDGPTPYADFAQKPGLTLLPPGESWQTALHMSFL